MKQNSLLTKCLLLTLSLILVFSVSACRTTTPPAEEPPQAEVETEPEVGPYKIGIMTGTVSQGEEEYQEAMNQIAKYGDKIVHATYPDNFSTETETTISQVVQMASDPEVKAIVFVQAIPGAAAAIEKVRETRPDMLFVAGVPAEDPPVIAGKADIVMQVDEISMGRTIPELAAKMGAKTFIHYSFPRHMSYELLSRRRNIMEEACKDLGIKFHFETAPDPTSDVGVAGAQHLAQRLTGLAQRGSGAPSHSTAPGNFLPFSVRLWRKQDPVLCGCRGQGDSIPLGGQRRQSAGEASLSERRVPGVRRYRRA